MYADINQTGRVELLPVSPDKFVSADGRMAMEFNLGANGNEMVLRYTPDGLAAHSSSDLNLGPAVTRAFEGAADMVRVVANWLRDQLPPVYDAITGEPIRGVSIGAVQARLAAEHVAKTQKMKAARWSAGHLGRWAGRINVSLPRSMSCAPIYRKG